MYGQLFLPLKLLDSGFLYYALVFFVLALVAGLLGVRGVAGISMEIARLLVLAVLSIVL